MSSFSPSSTMPAGEGFKVQCGVLRGRSGGPASPTLATRAMQMRQPVGMRARVPPAALPCLRMGRGGQGQAEPRSGQGTRGAAG